MGRLITLICDETPGLALGPGVGVGYIEDTDPPRRDVIKFGAGYAQFDEDDYKDWRKWVEAKGTPHIEIIEGDSGQVPATFGLGFDCPTCGKSFAAQRQLNGHRMAHAPRRAPVTA